MDVFDELKKIKGVGVHEHCRSYENSQNNGVGGNLRYAKYRPANYFRRNFSGTISNSREIKKIWS